MTSFQSASSNMEVDIDPINTSSDVYYEHIQTMRDSASKFILSLHSISRADVNKIRENVENNIVFAIVNFLKKSIPQLVLQDSTMKTILNDIAELFSDVKTEYRFEKRMKEMDLISTPNTFKVANTKNTVGTIMPLEFQFKKIFESDNFLDKVLHHMEEIKQNNKIINFIQGDLWIQKIRIYPQKTLIPFFIYVDDFGINNPIGSKSTNQAMCNVYFSFPCLPEDLICFEVSQELLLQIEKKVEMINQNYQNLFKKN
ncbi:hypothetical protein FF38_04212 [Lucilia cuprina]|uniref:Uncharacterized protein n=1 Tax=Lucilia cuprina TaxID=7375 RepID=A0A0L0BLS6_LUCCU|nr:hypothetical protein FF38_04212 [Lucilia cuprina]